MKEREILTLRRKVEAEYQQKLRALDLVLEIVRARDAAPSELTALALVEGDQKRRVRGVLAAVRRLIPDLPERFDRTHVMEKLQEINPNLASKVTLGNLRSTLRLLARDGDIDVVSPATSSAPAVYSRQRAA